MKLKSVPIESFHHPLLSQCGVRVDVKRDDLIHPVVSGNKLYKLHFNLVEFERSKMKTLVTFGGAYSNHLHAVACVGKELGVPTVGIVRGEQLLPLNPTLKDCVAWGMTLEPVSRTLYRQKNNSEQVQDIISKYESVYLVPEGGGNLLGVQGAALMLDGVQQDDYDVIAVASGTGATVAGLISASEPNINVIGFATLKGATWMVDEVEGFLEQLSCSKSNWQINCDYHFGGYGKKNNELSAFVDEISRSYGLDLEPVYTGKAFYGVLDLIARGVIKENSRVLFIHSGGLQGMRT
ncbi:MAG: pyridoxal-phosphate dependent enzyme [Bermanella sp.]